MPYARAMLLMAVERCALMRRLPQRIHCYGFFCRYAPLCRHARSSLRVAGEERHGAAQMLMPRRCCAIAAIL